MPQVVVRIAVDELRRLQERGLTLWGTPGESEPYWAERPRFPFDVGLATADDFLSANGYTSLAAVPPGRVLEFMVEMPAPPRG
jgi:hypothetical protein